VNRVWYDVIGKHVIGLLSTEGRPRKKWSLAFRGRTKHQEQGDPAAGCQESPTLLEQLLLRIAKPPSPDTTTTHSSATHSPLYHRHHSHLQIEKEHLRSCLSRPSTKQRAPTPRRVCYPRPLKDIAASRGRQLQQLAKPLPPSPPAHPTTSTWLRLSLPAHHFFPQVS
jgi:hypothetical protein